MKIFFDPTPLLHHPSGVSVYLQNFLKGTEKLFPETMLHTGMSSVNILLHNEIKKRFTLLSSMPLHYHARYIPGRMINHLPFLGFNAQDYDVMFFPGHICPPHVPVFELKNAVFVVHDMFLWHRDLYPTPTKWQRVFIDLLPAQLERSQAVITVSEFSKQEIIKYTGIASEKIHVIPNAVQWNESELSGWQNSSILNANRILPKQFFLSVSSLDKHKNHVSLIHAFKQFGNSKDYHGEKLVIVGKRVQDDAEVMEKINSNDNIIHLEKLSKTDLLCLYHQAKGFISVSLMEGFGIPLLEAMSTGCPACYSAGTSMDEIGRNAAIKVNPHDINEIAQTFAILSEGGSEIEKMSKNALEISREYSIEKIVNSTFKIFTETSKH